MNAPSPQDNPFLKLMRRYRDDPVRFAQEVIGIEPDEWQVELLDAIAAPAVRRVSVRSGHGVGKSTGVAMAAIWHVLMRYPSKTVVTAPTSAQLFDACFAEMKNVAKRLKPPFNNLLEIKSDRIELKSAPESTFISCRTSRSEQPEALGWGSQRERAAAGGRGQRYPGRPCLRLPRARCRATAPRRCSRAPDA